MTIYVRDVVKCSRLGRSNKYKVIDVRGNEARIQNVDDPKDIHWMYTAHLQKDAKASVTNRYQDAQKILNKQGRK